MHTKYGFEKNRIDNLHWNSVSELSSLPSLLDNGKLEALKTPLFYLAMISVNNDKRDIYFINNTDQTLSFVAPFKLYKTLKEAGAKLGDTSADNLQKVTLYADDMQRLYTDVLPNQGVRIDRTNICFGSDYLMPYVIQVPFKAPDSHYGIWHFSMVEKAGIGKGHPLLWNDLSAPIHMVQSECVSKQGEMPIEPSVYEERCWVLDCLIESLGVANALFVLAINDVLYRYCVGWSAPYNESDIQAKDIAYQLQQRQPNDADTVKDIVQAVYNFWFDEGFAKNISVEACEEILDLYQEWLTSY